MKILQVHNRYRQAGGEDTVVSAERSLLESAGHEVTAFEAENPTDPLRTAGHLVLSPWNPVSARRLAAVLDERLPDVAHVHNTWYSITSSVLGTLRRRRVPVVATVHNYRMTCLNGQLFRAGAVCEQCVGEWPSAGIRYACYRDSTVASLAVAASSSLGRTRGYWHEYIDRYVAMTEFSRQILIRTGITPDKIAVKPHFAPDLGSRLARPSDSDTVLFVGRLGPEKGILPLLQAWARAETGSLRLRLVGDGPLREEIERELPAGVELVGWIDRAEVEREMRSARALVFPSVWYETFGMVLIEAMALGLPVLASDIAGVPETVGDGLPHPRPGDVESWIAGLEHLADADVDEAGRLARRRYLERYTPEQGLANLERLYREAIEARR